MRTRVKICGITRPEDARAAARLGADAIGLVFYPPSPRAVSIEQAQAVVAVLPPFVTAVGLFVDERPERIREVVSKVRIDLLQFHGDECPADCDGFERPYLKAVRMREGVDLAGYANTYPAAAGLLLDSYQAGIPGGTGTSFDWSRVPQDLDKPIILAGGLDPDNVAEVIRITHPYGVDVSGGVEQAKGIKDAEKMAAFIRGVNRVDADAS